MHDFCLKCILTNVVVFVNAMGSHQIIYSDVNLLSQKTVILLLQVSLDALMIFLDILFSGPV